MGWDGMGCGGDGGCEVVVVEGWNGMGWDGVDRGDWGSAPPTPTRHLCLR